MTKGCGKFEDALLDMVYDELDESEAEALRAHAADCPECAAAVSELLSVRRLSSRAFVMEPPTSLDARIFEQAKAQISRAPAPVKKGAPAMKPDNAPGFRQMLRAWLLHPAFAGAAMIAVVLTVTVFITDNAKRQTPSFQDAKAVLAERSRAVSVPPASKAETAETISEETPPTAGASSARPKEHVANAETEIVKARPKAQPPRRRSSKAGAPKIPDEPVPSPVLRPSTARKGAENSAASRARSSAVSEKRRSGAAEALGIVAGVPPTEEAFSSAPPPRAEKLLRRDDEDVPQEMQLAPAPAAKRSSSKKAKRSMDMLDAPDDSYAMKMEKESSGGENYAMEKESESAENSNNAYAQGMKAYRRGDCGEAVIELTRVIAAPLSYPGKVPSALYHIARCEKQTGRCAQAVRHYEELSARYLSYAKRPEALYEAAGCYKRMGRKDKAREVLKELEALPGWKNRARELLQEL
jgi:TolA-binding protein/anti-sigma factor RsiW